MSEPGQDVQIAVAPSPTRCARGELGSSPVSALRSQQNVRREKGYILSNTPILLPLRITFMCPCPPPSSPDAVTARQQLLRWYHDV